MIDALKFTGAFLALLAISGMLALGWALLVERLEGRGSEDGDGERIAGPDATLEEVMNAPFSRTPPQDSGSSK
jgi:hypothetical protein